MGVLERKMNLTSKLNFKRRRLAKNISHALETYEMAICKLFNRYYLLLIVL